MKSCYTLSVLTLLDGQHEGHPTCKKLTSELLAWLSVLGKVQIAYGPADATATHRLLLH